MDPVDPLASYRTDTTTLQTTGGSELGRDAFLQLLTTQLANQDPTSPMSNEDFIAQLATFSSLEQMTGMNDTMTAVYGGIVAMNNASMATLLGRDAVAAGDQFLVGDDASWPRELHYDAAGATASGTLTVTDAEGVVVARVDLGALSAGEGVVSFDGKDFDGQKLPPGTYTFSIDGLDSDGATVQIDERIVGEIDAMDYSSGTPQPSIDGVPVQTSDIVRLAT